MERKIFFVVLLLSILIFSSFPVYSIWANEGKFVLNIRLFDSETGLEYNSPPNNLLIFSQIFAIAPPNESKVLDEIYKGEVLGRSIILTTSGKLGEIARKWLDFEKIKGPIDDGVEVGLQVNLWLINTTNGAILQRFSYYYTYSPSLILQGRSYVYDAKIMFSKSVIVENVVKKMQSAGALESGEEKITYLITCPYVYPYWVVTYVFVPENNTSVYGNNIRQYGGTYYVKTPILTIYNQYTASGVIGASINIALNKQTWLYVSVGIGFEIEKKLKNGDVTGGLSRSIFLAGQSKKEYYGFGRVINIGPEQWGYIWIWARPVSIFYREALYEACSMQFLGYTGYEKIDSFIQDTIKNYMGSNMWLLEGGYSLSQPPDYYFNWLMNSNLNYEKYIGALQSEQAYPLSYIIRTFVDTCQADFELSISIGLLLAAVLTAISGGAAAPFAALLAMISISISWGGSASVYLDGVIQNFGPIIEFEYMRFSNLQYKQDPLWWCLWCSTCYYEVPVALYFRSV